MDIRMDDTPSIEETLRELREQEERQGEQLDEYLNRVVHDMNRLMYLMLK